MEWGKPVFGVHLLPHHTDTAWLRLEDCHFSYVFFQRFLQVSIQSELWSFRRKSTMCELSSVLCALIVAASTSSTVLNVLMAWRAAS
jgi:hypothetical protein